jgi:hypothetical protein
MMVALLLYCWSRGVRSARRIERACLADVACRVVAAQQRPDHATIARFVVRHERALGELFGEVLGLCAYAGLATVGVLAIDGTKVAANANRLRVDGARQKCGVGHTKQPSCRVPRVFRAISPRWRGPAERREVPGPGRGGSNVTNLIACGM